MIITNQVNIYNNLSDQNKSFQILEQRKCIMSLIIGDEWWLCGFLHFTTASTGTVWDEQHSILI